LRTPQSFLTGRDVTSAVESEVMRGVADVAVALIVIVALARGGESAGTLVVVSVLALLYFAVRVATSGARGSS